MARRANRNTSEGADEAPDFSPDPATDAAEAVVVDIDDSGKAVEAPAPVAAPEPLPVTPVPVLPKPFPHRRAAVAAPANSASASTPVEKPEKIVKSDRERVRCLVTEVTQYGKHRITLKAGETIELTAEVAKHLRKSNRVA